MPPSPGRRLLHFAGIAAALLGALCLLGTWAVFRTIPDRAAGAIDAPGLGAEVRIDFDDRARPWVEAESFGDALYALGWLHVSERRFQLELLRRAGRARLAELLGPDLLATDTALLRAGVPELARRLEANASPASLALVDRYLAGARLAHDAGAGAPELLLLAHGPTPLERADVFAIAALMAFDSANNLDAELLRLALVEALGADAALFLEGDAIPDDLPWVVPPDASTDALALRDALAHPARPSLRAGSSAWAVAPHRTAGGHALLAFDSHDAWSMPSLLYEAHLFWRDADGASRQLRGFTAPGLPAVINGWTDGGAWGLTNIGDSQDLVLEQRAPDAPDHFLDGGVPYAADVHVETVPVRGGDPVSVRIVTTRHGPLVQDDPPLALQWTGHRVADGSLDGLLDLNRARSWADASDAVDRLPAPVANLTWADTQGRIATRVHGLLPVRARGVGRAPLDAADGPARWTGLVPADALPRRVDPVDGQVVAANARTAPPGTGPLVSADNAPGYRSRRIHALLGDRADLDVDDFRRMQLDTHDVQAERLLPALLGEVDTNALSPDARTVLHALREFEGAPLRTVDSSGALAFAYVHQALLDVLFAEALGPELHRRLLADRYRTNHAVDRLVLEGDHAQWWRGNRPARLTESLNLAAERLVAVHGAAPTAWRWGDAHQVKFPHALGDVAPVLDDLLSRGPWPWGGGNATLARARFGYHRPFEARGGASMRMVVELTDPPTAHVVLAGGQAGHPFDAHYDDQFDAFLSGDLQRLAQQPGSGTPDVRLLPAPAGRDP